VDLLTADYTFVNERLARHYGIPNVYGSRFRRVTLPADMDYRWGLLGKGSFLAVTWTQNFRSSPVKRGAWVLENILGTPPPEPPANVPALEETKGDGKPLTLRDQMTLHRTQQPCAGCHKIMDPIGFALEYTDMPTVRAIAHNVDTNDNRFSAIVLGVVRSAQFRMRVKGT